MKITKKFMRKSYSFLLAVVMAFGLCMVPAMPTYASTDELGTITRYNDGLYELYEEVNNDLANITDEKGYDDYLKARSIYGALIRPTLENHGYYCVSYRSHVQSYGWQGYVSNGSISGTVGKNKRLEAISIKIDTKFKGGIEYRTCVPGYGWDQGWKRDGEISGTCGESKKITEIEIKLYGEVDKYYDVWYRVYNDDRWSSWAKNGICPMGNTWSDEGYGVLLPQYYIQAIEIVLVPEGWNPPGIPNDY